MTIRIKMTPSWEDVGLNNGVGQVIYNFHRWMPGVGIEFVDENWDVLVSHLGTEIECDVHHNHGLWLGKTNDLMGSQNRRIIDSALCAKHVIVPSNYVANYFKRDMRLTPHVVGHGVNIEEWEPDINRKYVLWNKNRQSDVCDPTPVYKLAEKFPNIDFLTTFSKQSRNNIMVTGTLKFNVMKRFIRSANIYLATTKETFGIGTLEAMACAVPVLGFNWGGTADIVTHMVDGYLAQPHDYDDLAYGLSWLIGNRRSAGEAAREKAKTYTWLKVVEQLRDIYES